MIKSLEHRLAKGRPVLTKDEVMQLTKRIVDMTSADTVMIYMTHTANVITRMANGQVLSADDGDDLEINIATKFRGRSGVSINTIQVDDSALRSMVERCEE